MSTPVKFGLEVGIWVGGRYTNTSKISHVAQEASAQHVADVLRSLARDVERRAGLRPQDDVQVEQ